METIKSAFESLLFATRWLLAPFYVALVIALACGAVMLMFLVMARLGRQTTLRKG